LLKKYIKWGVWRVAVCPSYISDARFLKVNTGCYIENDSIFKKFLPNFVKIPLHIHWNTKE
jgi:hypothetical protein